MNSNTPLILFLGGHLSCTSVHLLTQAYLYAFTKLTPMKKVSWASLVAQLVKNPPPVQDILVQFLGREGPLAKQ